MPPCEMGETGRKTSEGIKFSRPIDKLEIWRIG